MNNVKIKRNMISALVIAFLSSCQGGSALQISVLQGGSEEDDLYRLQGTVSDTSDNLLPEVRVALKRVGVETLTDGNGRFTLSFKKARLPAPNQQQVFDYIELDKEGYQGTTLSIKSLSVFNEPFDGRLEPNPIGEDNVGFTVRINMRHALPLNEAIVTPLPPDYPLVEAANWQAYFSSLESRVPDRFPLERVSFHAYVPPAVDHLRAVFLISRHGIGSIDHPVLRDFAQRNGVALIGVLGDPMQRGFYPVDLLDPYLRQLGEMIDCPELADLPVLTFGHSNGTGFAGIIPSQHPERTIAWISYHSGASYHLQFPNVEQVPGMAMHGLLDQFLGRGQEETIQYLRRDRNAAINMMMEAYVGHGPVDAGRNATWRFIVAFCEAAMRIRLNADGTLRPVVIENGWLGGVYDRGIGGLQRLPIAPYADFVGDRSTANWLPDREFAEIWQYYGETDPRITR